jgi:hypothetical protein
MILFMPAGPAWTGQELTITYEMIRNIYDLCKKKDATNFPPTWQPTSV